MVDPGPGTSTTSTLGQHQGAGDAQKTASDLENLEILGVFWTCFACGIYDMN